MEQPAKEEEGEESGVEDHWYLVDAHGQKFRLPKTMLFLGREECDVVVASQSVDKRHAVLTFDIYLNRFKVKDLSTTNGTYVNNQPIKEQEYVILNHMDSVRLGNDSMMYHIEQGSQITSQGGHLPDHRVIPSWATRRANDTPPAAIHVHTHAMAECQGCIAEQGIDHSCGLHVEKGTSDGVVVNDPNHCMYPGNQPLNNQNLNYTQQQQQQQLSNPQPHCHHCQHLQHHHQNQTQYQHHPHHPNQNQQQPPYSTPESQLGHGQGRDQSVASPNPNEIYQHQHKQQHLHQQQDYTDHHYDNQNEILTQQDNLNSSQQGEQSGSNLDTVEHENTENNNVGPGRNTWPRKRARQAPHVATLFGQPETADDGVVSNGSEAKPSGPASAMYFVSFDDSVCNGSNTDLTANAQRITRNSSKSPFSKDLSKLKKGTPLYGQPDWWGESDGDGAGTATNTGNEKQDNVNNQSPNTDARPSSLVLEDKSQFKKPPTAMVSRGSTYMEIPVHGEDEASTSPCDNNATTPDGKGGIPTSISKDSLFSPDSSQPAKPSLSDISPSAEKNPAMSFTIDLDDHPPRKINIGSSLSQFVPTKIRKNFLERKDKAVPVKTSSTESTPSKNSEEREMSPNNQRKIEEIWSSLESKGKPSQLSSVLATDGSSLRSPNLEELEKLSELSSEDKKSSEKEAEKKGRKPIGSKGSPKVSRAKVGSVKPVASVSLSQYSDTTNYLIDKMFEGGAGEDSSSSSGVSSSPSSREKDISPEKKLYKEAASHDKPKALSSSSTKVGSKPPRSSISASKVGNNNKKLSSSSNVLESKSIKTVSVPDEDLKIVEKGAVDDKEDKASEAGTYTIEADEKEVEEEEMARNRIDEVFGVAGGGDVLNSSSLWRPVIDPAIRALASPGGYDNDPAIRAMASPGGYDNVRDDEVLKGVVDDDDDDDGDKTPLDEYGASLIDSLMIDEDGNLEDGCCGDDDAEEGDDDDYEDDVDGGKNDDEDPGAMGTEEVQTWVSQLTALTNHKASANHSISDSAKQAWDEVSDTSSVTKKPPHGLNRKRPGTGRKLPSIPTTDRSPVSSEHSSHVGEQDVSGLEDSMSLHASDLLLHNGKDIATANGRLSLSPAKSPHQVSSQLSKSSLKTTATTNGHSIESPSSSVVGGKNVQNGSSNMSSPIVSARSRGSVDTELLLQDTETVMAAMEARMANKKSGSNNRHRVDNNQDDSDTDVSSTVGFVNGDQAYKPKMYNSPREALSKNKRQSSSGDASKSSSSIISQSAKKSLTKSYSQSTVSSKSHLTSASPRNVSSANFTKKSVVSDVLSRRDSLDNDSIFSDVGSDAGDSVTSRSSSKSKGSMSMTKPNRAFQLRRARADSTEEPTTPRSAKSVGKSSVGSARSASLHSTSRVRSSVPDSGRSEASLGAQIVRKSRTNEKTEKARSTNAANSNLERNDGGRHSLRLTRASSLTIAPQSALTYPGKRETTPKSHLKSTYSSSSKGGLSVTGVSSGNRPQSQPGSRSNSPKAAERMAWKRRKEYDPRRAVAEAKSKTKEPGSVSSASSTSSISTRSKPSTRENLKRRMIRSASFGNSVNLASHGLDSLSNSHGLGLPERRDHHHHHSHNDEGFRRAFMPVHGSASLRSDRSAHSADEDDTVSSVTSTQGSGRNRVASTSNNVKSAFTPPPTKNKSLAMSPAPTKRRSSIHSTPGCLSLSVAPGFSNMDLDEPCNNSPSSVLSSPQTSYDSLIVSSIYQLSLKLSTTTDKTLNRLREDNRLSFTPSPVDDFMSDAGKSDFPAWKSANQELAGVLKNLRKLERHVLMMNRVIFPEEDMDSDIMTGREKQKYFQEIERIRSELAGFHPIDNPRREDYEAASPEMEEFSETF